MATDIEKMLRLVTGRSHVGTLEAPDAESVLRDESGREHLHLEISVRRDIIREARYTCDSDVSVGLAAAMAAAAGLAENRAIMSASLIGSADIERELSDGGTLDEADKPSAAMAALMLHECLRNYSMRYNQLREERLKRRDAEQK